MKLNPEQQKAANWKGGPCLVMAPPGTGKTFGTVHTIANLIGRGVSPDRILATTFTRNAAKELKDRAVSLEPRAAGSRIGTLHGLCFGILTEQGRFELLKSTGRINAIIREIVQGEKLDAYVDVDMARLQISRWKNDGVLWSTVSSPLTYAVGHESLLAHVYERYESRLRQEGLKDFDSLLLDAAGLLKNDLSSRARYQDAWDYILVDEAQDCNLVQWQLLHTLAERHRNLMVVGDSLQSLYRWRGAHPEMFENFDHHYPDRQLIFLRTTYRAPGHILRGYSKLGQIMLPPKFDAVWETVTADGAPPVVLMSSDEGMEAETIGETIGCLRQGRAWQDFCILARTNGQTLVLSQGLGERGIPYFISAQINFFDRAEIKLLVDWLRIIENTADDEALERIILSGLPRLKYFKKKAIEKLKAEGRPLYDKLVTTAWARHETEKAFWLYDTVEYVRKTEVVNVGELVKDIRRVTACDSLWTVDEDADAYRLDNIEAFQGMAEGFASIKDFLAYIEDSRRHQLSDEEQKPDAVEISTIHRAKGKEWAVVFVAGCVEGVLPHYRSSPEEERNCAFVAFSRASERLFLSVLATWRGKVAIPSRFLREAEYVMAEEKVG